MATIAVTGATGFIGSKICEMLLDNDFDVIGLTRTNEQKIKHSNYRHITVDLTDFKKVQTILQENEIDILLHFAAIAHISKDRKVLREQYLRVNYLASKNLFKFAYEKNIRVFFASSIDIYGVCRDEKWGADSTPFPITDYGKSKLMAENSLVEIFRDKKNNYLIGRLTPVYNITHMHDIYKRIYIKYPDWAFLINTNLEYQFLSINNLCKYILTWIQNENMNVNIVNLCDITSITAKDLISNEKKLKKAKHVVLIPQFIALIIAGIIKRLLRFHNVAEFGFYLSKLFAPHKLSRDGLNNINLCSYVSGNYNKNINQIEQRSSVT